MVQNVDQTETTNRVSGLMDGIDAGANDEPVISNRVEIGAPKAARRPIDAGWSKKKKQTVAASAAGLAIAAVAIGGYFMIAQRSVGLPKSAEEAVRVMSSARYDNLSEDRRIQYAAEAARLMQERDPTEVAGLFTDEDSRRVMREMGFAQMRTAAVTAAQDDEIPDLAEMFAFMRQMRESMPERERPDFESMTEEEREAMREERRAEMQQRMQQTIESGNPQNMVLMRQMFNAMRSQMGGQGGGRGGPRGMFGGGGRPGGGRGD